MTVIEQQPPRVEVLTGKSAHATANRASTEQTAMPATVTIPPKLRPM
jgi:hypothetical protein